MNIIHFDIDSDIEPYIHGTKYDQSLQELSANPLYEKADGITIKSVSHATKETLSLFPKLSFLLTRTVGVDHIDLDYCREKGIAVYHILDYGSFNIAEHVFALLLSGTRNILSSQTEISQGIFSYKGHMGIALKGKTLGVVGTGKIGLEVIKLAIAFGMKVVAFDVFKNETAAKELNFSYVSLEELASNADIITLHAPLLESTKHMINAEVISHMKDGIILINTARGGLIDTKALVNQSTKFRWIGLDVLENEDHFTKENPLLKLPNVIITPHIAFFSDESIKKIAEETERIIKLYEESLPTNSEELNKNRVV